MKNRCLSAFGAIAFTLAVALPTAAAVAADARPSALTDDPFLPDPSFAGGNWLVDNFGSNTRNNLARRVARLPNGDYVVAGVGHPPIAGQANGLWNLTLTRYSASGQPVAWNAQAQFLPVGPFHLVTRNLPDEGILDVHGIAVGPTAFYVLVNRQDDLPSIRPHLYIFNHDGLVLGYQMLAAPVPHTQYGAGLAVYRTASGHKLFIASSSPSSADPTRWLPRWKRWAIQPDGYLEFEAEDHIEQILCTVNSCRLYDLVASAQSPLSNAPPRFYLVGSHRNGDSANHNFLVMRVDANGVPVGSFGFAGATIHGFDQAGSALNDIGLRAAVRTRFLLDGSERDDVYATGWVDRACRRGTGVVALDHAGLLVDSFAAAGKLVVGGSAANATFCSSINPSEAIIYSPALSGDRLALAGYRQCVGCRMDASLAVVDTRTGALGDFIDLPWPLTGTPSRHSHFLDAVPSGGGAFVAVGGTRFPTDATVLPEVRGKYQFATLKLAPDRLFGHGFQ
jgi:hypothetical protein